MFDVTNKLSFDSLDYWLQEFTSNGGKQAVVAVVANKVRVWCCCAFDTVEPKFITLLQ